MKIWVARIPEEGSNYTGADPAGIIELDGDPFVRKAGDVQYELYAQRVSDELVVRGTLAVEMELRCARCSEFFSTTVTVSDFLRAYSAPDGTDSVDITEDFREEILLHVSGFSVCSDECKGVCAQCGADLNKGACSCEPNDGPSAWTGLDELNL
ncbi:YceD family protein [Pontiella sulfatireligans]|uniref:DUF177 domain-containing protein n=1 Tax=Pontiella sulfatireligans TaxID=2750658 RepID=A0A6C2UMT0_9BACT|nr:DUF177 domain-containing protein [Pontiella sulfatireligans]VGO20581.1 hypothetical protein SCARR_02646 [Pontiella sulfatireligans]